MHNLDILNSINNLISNYDIQLQFPQNNYFQLTTQQWIYHITGQWVDRFNNISYPPENFNDNYIPFEYIFNRRVWIVKKKNNDNPQILYTPELFENIEELLKVYDKYETVNNSNFLEENIKKILQIKNIDMLYKGIYYRICDISNGLIHLKISNLYDSNETIDSREFIFFNLYEIIDNYGEILKNKFYISDKEDKRWFIEYLNFNEVLNHYV